MTRPSQKTIFLLVFTILASAFSANALSLDKFVLDYQSEKGQVYFIRPHQMKLERPIEGAGSKIDCDYTIVAQTDTVRILATIETKSVARPTEFTISLGEYSVSQTPAIIYVQPKKNKIKTRVEIYIDYEAFLKLYGNPAVSPVFTFTFDKGERLAYAYPKKEWNKYYPLFQNIFSIIQIQKSNE